MAGALPFWRTVVAHMLGLLVQDKVVVVPGDLHKPGLGLSAEDEERITNEVQFVVHSAASISFFEHIHTLLEQNYEVSAPLHRAHFRRSKHTPWASHTVVLPVACMLRPCHSGTMLLPSAAHTALPGC